MKRLLLIGLCAAGFAYAGPARHSKPVAQWLMLALLPVAVVTDKITRTYLGSSESLTNQESPTGNTVALFDQSIAIGSNTHYVWNLKRSQLVSMVMTSDVDCDIYTNDTSGGSPTDHIVLKAGKTYVWTLAQDTLTAGPGLVKVPISADITAGIYVTNAALCRLKIKALLSA